MANHNDGMGMEHAVRIILATVNDASRSLPLFAGTFFEDELRKICAQMRKRIKIEKRKVRK